MRVLAVDDTPELLFTLRDLLEQENFDVVTASNGKDAIELCRNEQVDLVLLDVSMPGLDGFEVTRIIRAQHQADSPPIILLTSRTSLEDVRVGLAAGATDYIAKPYQRADLLCRIEAVMTLTREIRRAESHEGMPAELVGTSRTMRDLFVQIRQAARSEISVLVRGETGSGKELVSKAIHDLSDRAESQFVSLNCAALTETLLEAELFGHVKGSFTGAISDKAGLFETANGGTLFLDEVAEMSSGLQAKLLRVLQEGSYTPVGSQEVKEADVRIISATHRDLPALIREGKFREDLFYRLNGMLLVLPALRERADDIPALAERFLEQSTKRGGQENKRFSREALALLLAYSWPGNVRELKSEVERAVVRSGMSDMILPSALSPSVLSEKTKAVSARSSIATDLKSAIRELECEYIEKALLQSGGNKSEAAKMLGISRSSLIQKAKDYNLD